MVDAILGQQKSADDIERPVLSKVERADQPQLPEPLTEQEMNILALIVGGKINQQIADELFVTVGTVKWHVHNILQKLGVNNRTQATILVQELGLLWRFWQTCPQDINVDCQCIPLDSITASR